MFILFFGVYIGISFFLQFVNKCEYKELVIEFVDIIIGIEMCMII